MRSFQSIGQSLSGGPGKIKQLWAVATVRGSTTRHSRKGPDTFVLTPVQELLRHCDVKTAMLYTHVLNRGPAGVRSPLDGM